MDLPIITKEMVLTETESFLARSTTACDVAQLLRYLKASPATAAISRSLPADELEARLRCLQRSMNIWANSFPPGTVRPQSSAFDVSIFYVLPLDSLTMMEKHITLDLFYTAAKELVRIFLQLNSPANRIICPDTTGSAQVPRNKSEAQKCLSRDNNQCILTHTLNPEACHIVPYAINNEIRRGSLMRVARILKCIVGDDQKLLISSVGCSDRHWNMLSLNRQLHSWWARGYFAFKCLGVAPALDGHATVTLQFYWMPVQKRQAQRGAETRPRDPNWMEPVRDDDRRAFVEAWEAAWLHDSYGSVTAAETVPGVPGNDSLIPPGVVAACDTITGRPIQTGHVIELPMASIQDGLNMKAMIDVQWACTCLASMSGAAGDPDFLYDIDNADDEEDIYGQYASTGEY